MILLLDTTVLIDTLRERKERRMLLETLVETGHILATSPINIGEVYAGMRGGEEAETEEFLTALQSYPVTVSVAKLAGMLKRSQAARGRTFALVDMIVAATAIEHGLTLMTDNRKDFPIPELNLYPLS